MPGWCQGRASGDGLRPLELPKEEHAKSSSAVRLWKCTRESQFLMELPALQRWENRAAKATASPAAELGGGRPPACQLTWLLTLVHTGCKTWLLTASWLRSKSVSKLFPKQILKSLSSAYLYQRLHFKINLGWILQSKLIRKQDSIRISFWRNFR